jgi:hypothetical protein
MIARVRGVKYFLAESKSIDKLSSLISQAIGVAPVAEIA